MDEKVQLIGHKGRLLEEGRLTDKQTDGQMDRRARCPSDQSETKREMVQF